MHGTGWVALCWEHFDWPKGMHRHENHCHCCAHIQKQQIEKKIEKKIAKMEAHNFIHFLFMKFNKVPWWHTTSKKVKIFVTEIKISSAAVIYNHVWPCVVIS